MLTDALKGMRIIDLGIYIPGPTATLMLSDMGAEVVKVESPAGDPMEQMGPFDAKGQSIPYATLNRSKSVVRIDLKSIEGREAFAGMIKNAHVLVESFRPGVLDRLGFDADRLKELNANLVHCAISGWGQTGPMAQQAGHDLTHVALTGALWVTGTEDQPVIPFPPIADQAGASMAVSAVLAALLRRLRTGKGGKVEISLYEAALAWNRLGLVGAAATGRATDLLNGGAACYRVYRCRDDGFLAVAPIEPKFWSKFVAAIGHPELEDRLSDPMPQTDLIRIVAEVIATKDRQDWEAVFAPLDCCVTPVLTPEEAGVGAQARERGILEDLPGSMPGIRMGAPVEVLSPILLDGQAPPNRKSLRREAVEDVLARWGRVNR